MQKMTFVKACMEFFGKKPGQTTAEFGTEIKAALHGNEEYWKNEFAKIGVELTTNPV